MHGIEEKCEMGISWGSLVLIDEPRAHSFSSYSVRVSLLFPVFLVGLLVGAELNQMVF